MGRTLLMSSNPVPASAAPLEAEELDLAEITKRYSGRWVGMVVTSRDKNLQPTRGKVVADDSDRYMLRPKLNKYRDICIFYAGEPAYPLLL
jgi:hypothetical protein